jgi:putative transposase
MSKKRTKYTSTFKTKLVLVFKHLCEVIFDGLLSVVYPWFVIQATSINTQSLALLINRQKRTRHVCNILSQNLQNWKKTFLANAEIAMEPSKTVKEYKEELSVVYPWFVIQATSINTQSLALLINRQKRTRHVW